MAAESAAERLEMLTTDDFGVVVKVSTWLGVGIFDDRYAAPYDAGGTSPMLLMRTADVSDASISNGTTVTVDGTDYTARVLRQDGTGMTRIQLEDQ